MKKLISIPSPAAFPGRTRFSFLRQWVVALALRLLLLAGFLAPPAAAQFVHKEIKIGGSDVDVITATVPSGIPGSFPDLPGPFWFVIGVTNSHDFPVTDGSVFKGDPDGTGDIFVAKLDPEGNVLAATLLGGAGTDFANGLALGSGPFTPEGDLGPPLLTVSGWTNSTDFPTLNPIQAQNGGKTDAIIAQFDFDLNLLFSTYLGGTEDDQFAGVIPTGSFFVSDYLFYGFTVSTDFPFPTPNAAFSDLTVKNRTDNTDGLLVRLKPNRTLSLASLFRRLNSGNGTTNEVILGAASGPTDEEGSSSMMVTGWTDDPSFFKHASDQIGPGRNIFITTINPDTGSRSNTYSRMIGGSGDDIGHAIVSVPGGFAVVGQTTSPDLPGAANVFQEGHGGGNDAVIIGIPQWPSNPFAAVRGLYATYLGGSGEDLGRAIKFDGTFLPDGKNFLHLAGSTSSANLPLPADPVLPPAQDTYGGGDRDAFYSILEVVPNTAASPAPRFTFAPTALTYAGGPGNEGFLGLSVVGVAQAADLDSRQEPRDTLAVGAASASLEQLLLVLFGARPPETTGPPADLEVSLALLDPQNQPVGSRIAPGETLFVEVVVTNHGPTDSSGQTVVVSFADGFNILVHFFRGLFELDDENVEMPEGWSVADRTSDEPKAPITWEFTGSTSLPSGESRKIRIPVVLKAEIEIGEEDELDAMLVVANIEGNESDPNTFNNFSLTQVLIAHAADTVVMGEVYLDQNNNGEKDEGEISVAAAIVNAVSEEGDVRSTSTLGDGSFVLVLPFNLDGSIDWTIAFGGNGEPATIKEKDSPAPGTQTLTVTTEEGNTYAIEIGVPSVVGGNGSLTGRVLAGTEPQAKVAVYLDLDNSSNHESAEPVAFTDDEGVYRFVNLAPGTYRVRQYDASAQETPPGRAPHLVTLAAGETRDGLDFVNVAADLQAFVRVFHEDGTTLARRVAPGQKLIVEVEIWNDGPTTSSGQTVEVALSHEVVFGFPGNFQGLFELEMENVQIPDGWSVSLLPPSGPLPPLRLRFTGSTVLPANEERTLRIPITVLATGDRLDPAVYVYASVKGNEWDPDEDNDDAHARPVPIVPVEQTVVYGFVLNEADGSPAAGARIYTLSGEEGANPTESLTVTANANGQFAFVLPESNAPWLVGIDAGGAPTTVKEKDSAAPAAPTLSLATEPAGRTVELEGVVKEAGPGTGGLEGQAFSRTPDGNDVPLAGIVVYLDLNNSGAHDLSEPAAVTDDYGFFRFLGLTPGDYAVRQLHPAGQTVPPPEPGRLSVTVTAGTVKDGNDFVNAFADLELELVDFHNKAPVGKIHPITVKVRNGGGAPASDVVVTIRELPDVAFHRYKIRLEGTAAFPFEVSRVGGIHPQATVTLGSLPPGEEKQFVFHIDVFDLPPDPLQPIEEALTSRLRFESRTSTAETRLDNNHTEVGLLRVSPPAFEIGTPAPGEPLNIVITWPESYGEGVTLETSPTLDNFRPWLGPINTEGGWHKVEATPAQVYESYHGTPPPAGANPAPEFHFRLIISF